MVFCKHILSPMTICYSSHNTHTLGCVVLSPFCFLASYTAFWVNACDRCFKFLFFLEKLIEENRFDHMYSVLILKWNLSIYAWYRRKSLTMSYIIKNLTTEYFGKILNACRLAYLQNLRGFTLLAEGPK